MTRTLRQLSLFSALAVAALTLVAFGCPSEGEEGNLSFSDSNRDRASFFAPAGITPMATGSTVVFRVADARDDERPSLNVQTVTSLNPDIVQVTRVDGADVTMTGLQAGDARLEFTSITELQDWISVAVVDPVDFTVGVERPNWNGLLGLPPTSSILRGTSFRMWNTPRTDTGRALAGTGAESWTMTLENGAVVTPDVSIGDWSLTPRPGGDIYVTTGAQSRTATLCAGGETELVLHIIDPDEIANLRFSLLATAVVANVGDDVLIIVEATDAEGRGIFGSTGISVELTRGAEFATIVEADEFFGVSRRQMPFYTLVGSHAGMVDVTVSAGNVAAQTTIEFVESEDAE